MKALMFDRLGSPAEVISLRDVAQPRPASGEVLVRLLLSPIIPGDTLFTQGLYPEPVRPHLPGETAGNYGVGLVEAVGEGVDLSAGTLVAVTHRGSWAEYAAVPAAKAIPLPTGYRHELGAEFMNLVTAWDLIEQSGVIKSQWLAVTGGHATVSTILSQFAETVGIKILSIVRSRRDSLDLKSLGATEVLALDEVNDLGQAVLELTDGGTHGLIDCVGGATLGELMRTLRFGSRAVIYGGFASEPFQLHNLDLLLNGLEIRSYIYRYFFAAPDAVDEARIRQLLAFAAQINLRIPVAGCFALDQYRTAFAAPDNPGRKYFVLA
nr:zinc-binding dehydrogenase [uncultured Sphingomonas sp.]